MPRNPQNKPVRPGVVSVRGKAPAPPLTGGDLERYNELKEELNFYQKERNSVWDRRSNVKQILDNFDRVIAEDIVADTSGYSLNAGEIDNIIDNSVILSKSEIEIYINELNSNTVFKEKLKLVNNIIFKNPKTNQLSKITDELGENETYSQYILILADSTGLPGVQADILDGYVNIINQLETQLL